MLVVNNSGAKAIYLLLCDHQDTEYEQQGMKIGVSWTIFT